jgi:hypothetical protein
MSRNFVWSTLVFATFAFVTLMVFFWVREGSLEGAGAAMDRTLGTAGAEVVNATETMVEATDEAVDRATDGDDRT